VPDIADESEGDVTTSNNTNEKGTLLTEPIVRSSTRQKRRPERYGFEGEDDVFMFSLDTIQLHLVQFCWLYPYFSYNIILIITSFISDQLKKFTWVESTNIEGRN